MPDAPGPRIGPTPGLNLLVQRCSILEDARQAGGLAAQTDLGGILRDPDAEVASNIPCRVMAQSAKYPDAFDAEAIAYSHSVYFRDPPLPGGRRLTTRHVIAIGTGTRRRAFRVVEYTDFDELGRFGRAKVQEVLSP